MKKQNLAPFRGLALLTLLTLLLAASPGKAQFTIDWFTLDGGGGQSSGGPYTLAGTIGQPDAGAASGGGYTLQGGFWSGVAAESAPALRILRDGANVLLAWPNPATGFQLQESSSLTTPDWTDVNTPPALVGDERQVSQPLGPTMRFFRLHKP